MTQKNPFLLLDSLFNDLFNNTYSVFEKKNVSYPMTCLTIHILFERKINVSCQFFQQLKFNLTACHGSFMIIFHYWKFLQNIKPWYPYIFVHILFWVELNS